jgi:hypothetical protein
MMGAKGITTKQLDRLLSYMLLSGIVALLVVGCSSNGVVQETTYLGGMETSSALVQGTADGGYRTISGNPIVVVNDEVEPENMLPYGGGEEGIRQAEDESTTYMGN